MVTPEYVSPAPASQFPQQGPGMFTDTPTDKELFGMGLLEVPKYGDPCENGCENCMPGGNCQTCPHGLHLNSCPDCRQNGGSCVPPGYGNSDSQVPPEMPAIDLERSTLTKPVSSSRTVSDDAKNASGVSHRKSTTSSGTARSESSGLISPTMR